MPVDSGRDGTPRSPRLRDLELLLAAWPRFETLDPTHRFCQSEIADRPNIGLVERHQKIDISGPGAYPDDREKLVTGALLVFSSQLRKSKVSARDRGSETPTVTPFLPTETNLQQLLIIQLEKGLRSQR